MWAQLEQSATGRFDIPIAGLALGRPPIEIMLDLLELELLGFVERCSVRGWVPLEEIA
jgi:hypothetical protein